MTLLSIPERVANGVALLDAEVPNWVDSINLDTLNLWSTENCVLGQVFGDYFIGHCHLGMQTDDDYNVTSEHGFNLGGDYEGGDYRPLTDEWVRVIVDRL